MSKALKDFIGQNSGKIEELNAVQNSKDCLLKHNLFGCCIVKKCDSEYIQGIRFVFPQIIFSINSVTRALYVFSTKTPQFLWWHSALEPSKLLMQLPVVNFQWSNPGFRGDHIKSKFRSVLSMLRKFLYLKIWPSQSFYSVLLFICGCHSFSKK